MTHAIGIGFRTHLGWAACVALGGGRAAPSVRERRRFILTDPAVPESFEPYHKAAEAPLARAERIIQTGEKAVHRVARRELRRLVKDLSAPGDQVTGCAILMGAGRSGSSLEATLRSHALVHTAEGQLMRAALRRAGESCALATEEIGERELFSRASDELRISEKKLGERLSALGRELGPPWRQDQKYAALAAWLLLPR